MNTRILLAGILGGIGMFIWTSLAHMVLPLGEAGLREIPNETAVLGALNTSMGENRGLFVFPGPGLGPTPSQEQKSEAMKHMDEKLANNPSGIIMYFPPGRKFPIGRALGVEFATELVEAILVVWLLSQTVLSSFVSRLTFVTVAGVIAAIATNISYWNWYGFPKRYTAAYIFIQVVGFFIIGLISAFLLRKKVAITR
ncbi:MAG: hypothetical protein ACR2HH_10010 [Chthoniobacterales bacterium]